MHCSRILLIFYPEIAELKPDIYEGPNGIRDLLSNFTMGSYWIMDPILHLVERSSAIIYPTLGSTDMFEYYEFKLYYQ